MEASLPSFTFSNLLSLLLVLVLFSLLLVFLNEGTQAFQRVGSCDQNPNAFWCQGAKQIQDKTAKLSANAIACAVNSVASGQDACPAELKEIEGETLAGPRVKCEDAGGARSETLGSVSVDVGTELAADEATAAARCQAALPGSVPTALGGGKYDCALPEAAITRLAAAKCITSYGETARLGELQERLAGTPRANLYFCTGTVANRACKVKDLDLPQRIENAGAWSELWGDPAYLVYWQSFPPDEVTWTYKTNLVLSLGIAALGFVPVGKLAAGVSKTVLKSSFAGSATLIKREGLAAAGAAIKTAAKNEMRKTMAKIAEERLLKRFGKSAALFGGATLVQYAAELADSMAAKFEVIPNTIVYKQPSALSRVREKSGVQEYKLDPIMFGKPVLSKWPDHAFWGLFKDKVTEFHLVSPCYLNEITFSQKLALCGNYTTNRIDNSVTCTNPRLKDDPKRPLCGAFTEDTFARAAKDRELYGTVRSLLQDEKALFEQDGALTKITVPPVVPVQEGARDVLTEFTVPTGIDLKEGGETYDATALFAGQQLTFSCQHGTERVHPWQKPETADATGEPFICELDDHDVLGLQALTLASELPGSGFTAVTVKSNDAELTFSSSNGREWDELLVKKNDLEMGFASIAAGNAQQIRMVDCRTSAVVATDLKPSETKGENYCMRRTNTGQVLLDVGSYAFDAATIVAYAIPIAGQAAAAVRTVLILQKVFTAAAAAANVASAVSEEIEGNWPSGFAK